MSGLISFMYKHGVITTLIVLWALVLVTWVTWRVFGDSPPDIPASTVGAFTAVFGLPAIVIGLWKWRNGGDKS